MMQGGLSSFQEKVLLDLARKTIGFRLNTGGALPEISKEQRRLLTTW